MYQQPEYERAWHGAQWRDCEVPAPAPPLRPITPADAARNRVIDAFADSRQPLTMRDLAYRTKLPRDTVQRSVNTLLQEGRVIHAGVVAHSGPGISRVLVYRLAE